MAEPNDQLNGLAEAVRRTAEDGLEVLLNSRRHLYGDRELVKWAASRTGNGLIGRKESIAYVLDLLATLPKGTSLCIK